MKRGGEYSARIAGIEKTEIKPQVHEWTFADGHSIIVLSEGRLMNLGNATGHPSFVMSASFTNQTLAQIELFGNPGAYEKKVYTLPKHLDEKVARLHLAKIGAKLTRMEGSLAAPMLDGDRLAGEPVRSAVDRPPHLGAIALVDLLAGAEVHRLGPVVRLGRRDDPLDRVVDVKELARRGAVAPEDHLGGPRGFRLEELPDHRGDHVARREVEVVARAVVAVGVDAGFVAVLRSCGVELAGCVGEMRKHLVAAVVQHVGGPAA